MPRRSLFNNLSPGKSRLPQIVSFGGSEDGEDQVSEFTAFKSPRPNPNNPLLPIQLNRKISVLMQDSETVTKKIQLPPQATIAVFDEKDQTIKQATGCERPMPFENHQPKWKKVTT